MYSNEVDDGSIIPITEWPVTGNATTSNNTEFNSVSSVTGDSDNIRDLSKNFLPKRRSTVVERPKFHARFQPYNTHKQSSQNIELDTSQCRESRPTSNTILTKQQSSKCVDVVDKSAYLTNEPASDQTSEAYDEQYASIDIKIAKWWRKHNAVNCVLPKGVTANTTLYHISRLPDCKKILIDEKEQLLRQVTVNKDKADIHAALAGVEDRLGNFISGLKYIEQALHSQPDNPNFKWLKEKLRRQCHVQERQEKAKPIITRSEGKLPPFLQVQRVSGRDLTVAQFQEMFVKQNKPVILTDVVKEMSKHPFDFSLVKAKAGNKSVRVKRFIENSVEWARLEDGSMKNIGQFIEEVQSDTTSEYLFDWSLPIHCPELSQELSLPAYFKDNLLLITAPGSMYRDSWPSLFIAPKGAVSNLHIDAFASHFWMALFQGEKRWTFFDPKDVPFLYPKYFHSMDPVFDVDMGNPDLEKCPLLALTQPQQCVLKPGELLFVPAGSPHYVENLTASLAVSSNYVNKTNFEKVCMELKVNAQLDPRARDLLKQFEQPDFETQAVSCVQDSIS